MCLSLRRAVVRAALISLALATMSVHVITGYSNTVFEALHRQQHPPSCQGRLLLLHLTGMERDGLGSVIHTVASALAEGFHSQRTVILAPSTLAFIPTGDCVPDFVLDCLFQPLSSCTFHDIPPSELEHLYSTAGSGSGSSRLLWSEESRGNIAFFVPPAKFRTETTSQRHWAAQLIRYVMRLRPEVMQRMKQQHHMTEWVHPVLGVHIRHGDSHFLQKPHIPFHQYVTHMQQLAAAHHVQSIYVASDDEAVGLLLEQWGPRTPKLLILDRIRVPNRPVSEFPYQYQNNSEYIFQALADVWLLSQCELFLGTLSSHFSAIPALLRHAWGHVEPPVFLDINGVLNQSFQVGLLHIGNLGRGAAADAQRSRRWLAVARRFLQLHPELVDDFVANFTVSRTDGMPRPSPHIFDRVLTSWQPGALPRPCPVDGELQAVNGSTVRSAIVFLNTGTKLWNAGLGQAARHCWKAVLAMNEPTRRTQALKNLQRAGGMMARSLKGGLFEEVVVQGQLELDFWGQAEHCTQSSLPAQAPSSLVNEQKEL